MKDSGNDQRPIAHVRKAPTGEWIEHSLKDHLHCVGAMAGEFATGFGAADWARIAGQWHDLGKYRPGFQTYIRNASGYEREEAHIEGALNRVDHSTAGAIYAKNQFGTLGHVLAYVIAGHHAGLPDWNSVDGGASALSIRLENTKYLEEALQAQPPDELLSFEKPRSSIPGGIAGFALWVRMLFSALVDADFLDTEAFMDEGKAANRSAFPSLLELKPAFDSHMAASFANTTGTVNVLRANILAECRSKGQSGPGLFTLTVPTGGGKTLSSMAFALEHAHAHHKRRIIYVIPFTSIIEQTADTFRKIFGDAVIEHHSNAAESSQENHKSRLACENWDAPLIVTTSVQFFESLFAARTSRCRKLHNIVNSIVVLDEAQLMPPELREPILHVMNLLILHYGVTFVLSTATQPALTTGKTALSSPKEIVSNPAAIFKALERVAYEFPVDANVPTTWEKLAVELAANDSVLAIVNSRADCRALHALMPAGTIHLSALMCGEHRSQVITEIKKKLKAGEHVRVVSTQLVEAGVDMDFPVVYRALAGLDSIAQAAGRCNREGNLARGKVVVFVPPKPAPIGLLRKAEQATKSLLAAGISTSLPPELFTQYFHLFYGAVDDRKAREISELLKVDAPTLGCAFRSAAAAFKLIDDLNQRAVYVRYQESEQWLGILATNGPERWLLRKLQRYSVSLSVRTIDEMMSRGDIAPLYRDEFLTLTSSALYGKFGVNIGDDQPLQANDLVI